MAQELIGQVSLCGLFGWKMQPWCWNLQLMDAGQCSCFYKVVEANLTQAHAGEKSGYSHA